jgi:hypothetical protein
MAYEQEHQLIEWECNRVQAALGGRVGGSGNIGMIGGGKRGLGSIEALGSVAAAL